MGILAVYNIIIYLIHEFTITAVFVNILRACWPSFTTVTAGNHLWWENVYTVYYWCPSHRSYQ